MATASAQVPRASPHHIGHHEYGGKNPSSPAPSAISASLRSSGRGSIRLAWNPRYTVTIRVSKVVIVRADVPVQSPPSVWPLAAVTIQYAGVTRTKKIV